MNSAISVSGGNGPLRRRKGEAQKRPEGKSAARGGKVCRIRAARPPCSWCTACAGATSGSRVSINARRSGRISTCSARQSQARHSRWIQVRSGSTRAPDSRGSGKRGTRATEKGRGAGGAGGGRPQKGKPPPPSRGRGNPAPRQDAGDRRPRRRRRRSCGRREESTLQVL